MKLRLRVSLGWLRQLSLMRIGVDGRDKPGHDGSRDFWRLACLA
jgi:hypothetical protein